MGKRGGGTAASSARSKKERLPDDSFALPVVFGCAAEPAGVRQYDGRDVDWMSWRVYVRAVGKKPLSAFVKKVRMVLHPTIPHPTRVLTAEPYETDGEGYGEFLVTVELVLREDVFHEAVSIRLSQTNLRLRAPEETAHTMPGGGGNGPEYVTSAAAGSAQRRAEGVNARTPVITECLDTLLVTPLAEAAESIEEAWARYNKGGVVRPRALGLLKKVPAWLLDEDRHVRRYEEVAAGVTARCVELEAATERLRWRRAAALQRQDRLKRLLEEEEAAAAAAAKRRRCEEDATPSGEAAGAATAPATVTAAAAAAAGDASPAAAEEDAQA